MGIRITAATSAQILNVDKKSFQVGQRLEGKVINLSKDGIATINIGGRTITALSENQLVQGQTLFLEITQTSPKVLAQRLNAEESQVLFKLGMPQTGENIGLIQELINTGMPIDKEHVSQLKQMTAEAKMLLAELDSGASIDIKSGTEIPIRTLLVEIMSNPKTSVAPTGEGGAEPQAAGPGATSGGVLNIMQDAAGETAAKGDVAAQTDVAQTNVAQPRAATSAGGGEIVTETSLAAKGGEISKIMDGPAGGAENAGQAGAENAGAENVGGNAAVYPKSPEAAPVPGQKGQAPTVQQGASAENASSAVDAGRPSDSQPARDAEMTTFDAAKMLLSGDSDKESLVLAAKKLLSEFSPQQAVKILESGRPFNLKSIILAAAGKKAAAESVLDIVKTAPTGRDEILKLAEILKSDISPEEKLTEIAKALGKNNPEVLKSAEMVKEQLQFTKNENPRVYYMPMPVKIEGEERRADLYYKNKSGRKKSEDFSVLVALETKNMGEVRCLVTRQADDYELIFALESQQLSDRFSENSQIIRSALIPIVEGSLGIEFTFSREEIDQKFFENEKPRGFDMRL